MKLYYGTHREELGAIEKKKIWELVEKSITESIDVKWACKLKLRPNGEITKHKARLVARGFLQKPSIDFDEVYAPLARLETNIFIVSIATYKVWKIHQLNVNSAFLSGPLKEEFYVSQLSGF